MCRKRINPLNAELNPICNLLVLLGDLTFKGPCIVSIFQYITNKMQRYTVYLYLENALHVSGGTSTHHQERIQLYLQHLVFVTLLLLSAAIVEELEPVWVCCGWSTRRGLYYVILLYNIITNNINDIWHGILINSFLAIIKAVWCCDKPATSQKGLRSVITALHICSVHSLQLTCVLEYFTTRNLPSFVVSFGKQIKYKNISFPKLTARRPLQYKFTRFNINFEKPGITKGRQQKEDSSLRFWT
jgi:hypothetical protein